MERHMYVHYDDKQLNEYSIYTLRISYIRILELVSKGLSVKIISDNLLTFYKIVLEKFLTDEDTYVHYVDI